MNLVSQKVLGHIEIILKFSIISKSKKDMVSSFFILLYGGFLSLFFIHTTNII